MVEWILGGKIRVKVLGEKVAKEKGSYCIKKIGQNASESKMGG